MVHGCPIACSGIISAIHRRYIVRLLSELVTLLLVCDVAHKPYTARQPRSFSHALRIPLSMANKAFHPRRAGKQQQFKQWSQPWCWPHGSESLPTHEMQNSSVPVKALNICLCLGKAHTTVIRCNYISTKAFPLKCFSSKGPALTGAKPVEVKHAFACVLWMRSLCCHLQLVTCQAMNAKRRQAKPCTMICLLQKCTDDTRRYVSTCSRHNGTAAQHSADCDSNLKSNMALAGL